MAEVLTIGGTKEKMAAAANDKVKLGRERTLAGISGSQGVLICTAGNTEFLVPEDVARELGQLR